MAGWPLIGRDEELDLLDQVVTGCSRSVVVSGGTGVGKSRLVADFVERLSGRSELSDRSEQSDRGRGSQGDQGDDRSQPAPRPVLVRATRSTATIPFGPFAAWAPDRQGVATTDRLEVLQAIARALLVDGAPVVVAVDDAHLLDEGSAALVLHLAAHTPATVVVTVRSGERCPDGVVALWKEGLADQVEIQPLSEPEAHELTEQVLGGPVEPATRRRLWAVTEGIPLYLHEVLCTGIDHGVLIAGDGLWRWRGGLPRSWRLNELMGDRLDQVSDGERRVLELVAFGEPLPVALLGELGCRPALADAEEHGFVEVDHVDHVNDEDEVGGAASVRFAHPLYGEVLRADVPVLVAQAHQRALATAALAIQWQDHDPLRVASWWLASRAGEGEGDGQPEGQRPGDPQMLLAAAHRALSVGDWELVDRLGRAAEASGAGPRAVLLRAAALGALQRVDEAHDLLAALSDAPLDDDLLAQAARARAELLFWRRGDHATARQVLARAATRVSGPARAMLRCHGGYLATFAGDPAEADRLATQAMAEAGADVALTAQALATSAFAWMCQGRTSSALEAAEKALPDAPASLEDIPNAIAVLPVAHALALVLDGRIDQATDVAEQVLALSRQDDVRISEVVATALVGRIALFRGRPGTAARSGCDALWQLGEAQLLPHWPAAILALGAAQTGDPATAEWALGLTAQGPSIPLKGWELGMAAAWASAARDDLLAARKAASEAACDAAAGGAWTFEMLALLDLVRFGSADTAAARLVELDRTIEGPYAAAAAVYAGAAAEGDADGLNRASERFEAIGALLVAADAAADAAMALRAAGRRDRSTVAAARARRLAAACEGACTPALRRLDADPLVDGLTRREREVVRLAAGGLTNRQIAARLYISIRTVNAHLNHAYAKLGTNDRHQAADLLPAS